MSEYPKTICAVDPGRNGGLAWVDPGERPVCIPMPDTEGDLIDLLKRITFPATANRPVVFYLEDLVRFMGKTPMSHMAVYAANWGTLKGAIMYSGSPLHIVKPQAWIKALGLGKADKDAARKDWKNKLKAEAQRLYPHLSVTLKTADALLLLEYAIREQRTTASPPPR